MIESQDELMILGSSRAAHHYVPQVFEDSLGMRCYNAGSDGICIYYYGMLASRIQRGCPPKMVILEVISTDADMSQSATFSHFGEFLRLISYLPIMVGRRE